MKILHFLWQGLIGGAERAVYQLAQNQSQQFGWQVSVAFGQAQGLYAQKTAESGLNVVDLQLQSANQWTSLLRLRKLLTGYDLHHFHVAEPLIMLSSLLVPHTHRVFTYRAGAHPRSRKQTFRFQMAGSLIRAGFSGVSANTAHAAQVAEKMWHLPEKSVHITYNGLNFDLLRPTDDYHSARLKMEVADETELVIGTVSNLKPVKRIDLLIRGVAALPGRWKLIIVGDGNLRQELESLAHQLGIAAKVLFVGRQEQVPNWLIGFDVFVLPSVEESFGNAAVEAMALGIPTIVLSDGGGVKEHIVSGQTGWIVQGVGGLQSCLADIQTNRQLASHIGLAGQVAVRARYTVDQMLSVYRQFYASVGLKVD